MKQILRSIPGGPEQQMASTPRSKRFRIQPKLSVTDFAIERGNNRDRELRNFQTEESDTFQPTKLEDFTGIENTHSMQPQAKKILKDLTSKLREQIQIGRSEDMTFEEFHSKFTKDNTISKDQDNKTLEALKADKNKASQELTKAKKESKQTEDELKVTKKSLDEYLRNQDQIKKLVDRIVKYISGGPNQNYGNITAAENDKKSATIIKQEYFDNVEEVIKLIKDYPPNPKDKNKYLQNILLQTNDAQEAPTLLKKIKACPEKKELEELTKKTNKLITAEIDPIQSEEVKTYEEDLREKIARLTGVKKKGDAKLAASQKQFDKAKAELERLELQKQDQEEYFRLHGESMETLQKIINKHDKKNTSTAYRLFCLENELSLIEEQLSIPEPKNHLATRFQGSLESILELTNATEKHQRENFDDLNFAQRNPAILPFKSKVLTDEAVKKLVTKHDEDGNEYKIKLSADQQQVLQQLDQYIFDLANGKDGKKSKPAVMLDTGEGKSFLAEVMRDYVEALKNPSNLQRDIKSVQKFDIQNFDLTTESKLKQELDKGKTGERDLEGKIIIIDEAYFMKDQSYHQLVARGANVMLFGASASHLDILQDIKRYNEKITLLEKDIIKKEQVNQIALARNSKAELQNALDQKSKKYYFSFLPQAGSMPSESRDGKKFNSAIIDTSRRLDFNSTGQKINYFHKDLFFEKVLQMARDLDPHDDNKYITAIEEIKKSPHIKNVVGPTIQPVLTGESAKEHSDIATQTDRPSIALDTINLVFEIFGIESPYKELETDNQHQESSQIQELRKHPNVAAALKNKLQPQQYSEQSTLDLKSIDQMKEDLGEYKAMILKSQVKLKKIEHRREEGVKRLRQSAILTPAKEEQITFSDLIIEQITSLKKDQSSQHIFPDQQISYEYLNSIFIALTNAHQNLPPILIGSYTDDSGKHQVAIKYRDEKIKTIPRQDLKQEIKRIKSKEGDQKLKSLMIYGKDHAIGGDLEELSQLNDQDLQSIYLKKYPDSDQIYQNTSRNRSRDAKITRRVICYGKQIRSTALKDDSHNIIIEKAKDLVEQKQAHLMLIDRTRKPERQKLQYIQDRTILEEGWESYHNLTILKEIEKIEGEISEILNQSSQDTRKKPFQDLAEEIDNFYQGLKQDLDKKLGEVEKAKNQKAQEIKKTLGNTDENPFEKEEKELEEKIEEMKQRDIKPNIQSIAGTRKEYNTLQELLQDIHDRLESIKEERLTYEAKLASEASPQKVIALKREANTLKKNLSLLRTALEEKALPRNLKSEEYDKAIADANEAFIEFSNKIQEKAQPLIDKKREKEASQITEIEGLYGQISGAQNELGEELSEKTIDEALQQLREKLEQKLNRSDLGEELMQDKQRLQNILTQAQELKSSEGEQEAINHTSSRINAEIILIKKELKDLVHSDKISRLRKESIEFLGKLKELVELKSENDRFDEFDRKKEAVATLKGQLKRVIEQSNYGAKIQSAPLIQKHVKSRQARARYQIAKEVPAIIVGINSQLETATQNNATKEQEEIAKLQSAIQEIKKDLPEDIDYQALHTKINEIEQEIIPKQTTSSTSDTSQQSLNPSQQKIDSIKSELKGAIQKYNPGDKDIVDLSILLKETPETIESLKGTLVALREQAEGLDKDRNQPESASDNGSDRFKEISAKIKALAEEKDGLNKKIAIEKTIKLTEEIDGSIEQSSAAQKTSSQINESNKHILESAIAAAQLKVNANESRQEVKTQKEKLEEKIQEATRKLEAIKETEKDKDTQGQLTKYKKQLAEKLSEITQNDQSSESAKIDRSKLDQKSFQEIVQLNQELADLKQSAATNKTQSESKKAESETSRTACQALKEELTKLADEMQLAISANELVTTITANALKAFSTEQEKEKQHSTAATTIQSAFRTRNARQTFNKKIEEQVDQEKQIANGTLRAMAEFIEKQPPDNEIKQQLSELAKQQLEALLAENEGVKEGGTINADNGLQGIINQISDKISNAKSKPEITKINTALNTAHEALISEENNLLEYEDITSPKNQSSIPNTKIFKPKAISAKEEFTKYQVRADQPAEESFAIHKKIVSNINIALRESLNHFSDNAEMKAALKSEDFIKNALEFAQRAGGIKNATIDGNKTGYDAWQEYCKSNGIETTPATFDAMVEFSYQYQEAAKKGRIYTGRIAENPKKESSEKIGMRLKRIPPMLNQYILREVNSEKTNHLAPGN